LIVEAEVVSEMEIHSVMRMFFVEQFLEWFFKMTKVFF
jgi:hypothetical protein